MLNHRLAGCYRYLVALSLSLATFFPLSAEALYQYEYTSNTFTGTVTTYYGNLGTFPLQETISVAFTSANLLTGGEDFEDISNFSLTLRDESEHGPRTIQFPPRELEEYETVQNLFTISSVDANGLPTDWNISVDRNAYAPYQGVSSRTFIQTSTSLDNTFGYAVFAQEWSGQSVNNPGTWTVTSPVPEPETYAMMLAGLGMIGYVGRRKQKGNQIEKN